MVTQTSGRRRANPRTYPSTSTASLLRPVWWIARGAISSVNIAGSRGPAPYTVVDDFTTSLATPGAFWHAASNCMVPMTLISFIDDRPPALPGVATTPVWTTVSTSSPAMTFAMTGLRMSARTNRTRPSSARGGTTSMPITVPIDGIGGQPAGTASTGVPRDAGHHHYLCHEYPQPDSNST